MEIKFEHVGYRTNIIDINYTFQSQQITTIMGASRSGKTFLIHLILGLISPLTGVITVGSRTLTKFNSKKTRPSIAYLFQDPTEMFLHSTVSQELDHYHKHTEEEKQTYLHQAGLTKAYLKRNPFTLSSGEQTKLALAITISMDPDTYILDDPTPNLDPQGIKNLIRLIKKLKQLGKTIIIISSNLSFVSELTDNILLLSHGKAALTIPRKEIPKHFPIFEHEGISIPPIMAFINLANTTKNVKLNYTSETKELMKDVYRHVS